MTNQRKSLTSLSAHIVSSFISSNEVRADELPEIIEGVTTAMKRLSPTHCAALEVTVAGREEIHSTLHAMGFGQQSKAIRRRAYGRNRA